MYCQIATMERVFLFDILSLGSDLAFDAGLRDVMQSRNLQKVCNVVVWFVDSSSLKPGFHYPS